MIGEGDWGKSNDRWFWWAIIPPVFTISLAWLCFSDDWVLTRFGWIYYRFVHVLLLLLAYWRVTARYLPRNDPAIRQRCAAALILSYSVVQFWGGCW